MSTTDLEILGIEIEANTRDAVDSINDLENSTRDLQDAIWEVVHSVNALGRRTQQAAPEMTRLNKATKSSAASIKLMRNANGLTTSSFIRMSAKIGATVIALNTLSSGIAKSIKLTNDYIENVNLFTVSMGPAAESAKDFAEEVSELLGIDPSTWMRYQGVFNTIISGFGVATEKANIMSQQLTQLGYDISSFFNISVEDAMTKIQSGISGELEPLRRLGYDLSVARLQQEAYSLGIEKSVTQMTQAEKAQLRYYAIMTQVTASHTDMARTIESPANQMRVLQAQITMTARAIGELFIPILNKVLPYVIAFTKVVRRAAEAVAQLLGVTLPTVDYSDASSALSGLSDDNEDLSDSFEDADEKAKEFKKTILGFDEINALKDNSDLYKNKKDEEDLFGDINVPLPTYDFLEGYIGSRAEEIADKMLQKIKDLVNWVKNLGTGFLDLREPLRQFKRGWDDAFSSRGLTVAKESLSGIRQNLREIFSDSDVKAAAQNYLNSFGYYLGTLAGGLATVGANLVGGIVGGFKLFLDKHKDEIKRDLVEFFSINADTLNWLSELNKAIAYISDIFSGENGQRIFGSFFGILYELLSTISGLITRIANDFALLIIKPFTDNKDAIKKALDDVLGLIADILEDVEELGGYLKDKLFYWWDTEWKDTIQDISDALSIFVGQWVNWFDNHILKDLSDVYDFVEKITKDKIKKGFDNLAGAVGNLAESFGDLVEAIIDLHTRMFEGWDDKEDKGLVKFLKGISYAISFLARNIMDVGSIIINFVSAIISVSSMFLGWLTGGDWEDASKQFDENVEGIRKAALDISENTDALGKDLFPEGLSGVNEKSTSKWSTNWQDQMGGGGKSAFKTNSFAKSMKDAFSKLGDDLSKSLNTDLLEKIGKTIKGWFSLDLGVDDGKVRENGYMSKSVYAAFGVFHQSLEEEHPKIANKLDQIDNDIKSNVDSMINDIQTSWTNARAFLGDTWENIRFSASEKWTAIKDTIQWAIQTAGNIVHAALYGQWGIVTVFGGALDWLRNKANEVWNGQWGIHTIFEKAIDKIKKLFNFKLEMPKIHFSLPNVNFDWWDTGLGFSVPTNFRIDWQYFVKGGLIEAPTAGIIGEAGAEAVLPLTDRRAMASIANSIADAGGVAGGTNGEYESMMLRVMQKALGNANLSVNVYSTLQTDDEAIARSASRGTAKLEYRYNPVG